MQGVQPFQAGEFQGLGCGHQGMPFRGFSAREGALLADGEQLTEASGLVGLEALKA
jgi:hypothetical protein